jgi:hypothetical protein
VINLFRRVSSSYFACYCMVNVGDSDTAHPRRPHEENGASRPGDVVNLVQGIESSTVSYRSKSNVGLKSEGGTAKQQLKHIWRFLIFGLLYRIV